MAICTKAVDNARALEMFYYKNPEHQMSEIFQKMQGLASMLNKYKPGTLVRQEFSRHHNLKESALEVNDIVKELVKADTWEQVAEIDDRSVVHELNLKLDQMMQTAIYAHVKPADFSETRLITGQFVNQYKALLAEDNTSRWMEKVFSGEFIRKYLPSEMKKTFDGFIVQKDRLFRRYKNIDVKRTKYRRVVNDVETGVTNLIGSAVRIFEDYRSPHVTVDQSRKLLKYFDADLQRQSEDIYDGDPFGMLKETLKDEMNIKEDNIESVINHMKNIYKSWAELNYGTSDAIKIKGPNEERDSSHYNPRDYKKSLLGFLYTMGDNIVDQLLSSEIPITKLDKTQVFFLQKFGDQRVDEIKAKFPSITLDPMKIRSGYVPIGKNNEFEQVLESVGKEAMFSKLDMFGARTKRAEANDTDFAEVLTADVELLRHVASDIALYTFGQDINAHIKDNAGTGTYQKWVDSKGKGWDRMEDGMFRRYADYVTRHFEDRLNPDKVASGSRTFQTFKKLALMSLGLQGTLGLTKSALNNYSQALIGRLNTISGDQYLNIRGVFDRDKKSPDKTLAMVADTVERETKDRIKGRKAGFIMQDIDAENMNKVSIESIDNMIKKGFELSEASISYGMALPLVGVLKGVGAITRINIDNLKNGLKDNFLSMAGSEQIIRNFTSKVIMNEAHAKYVGLKAAGKEPKGQKEVEAFVKDILKGSQYTHDRLDGVLHGDFDKQTKPFWSYSLNKAEDYQHLLTGLAQAQMYMFKQAGMFGMMGAISGGLAKPIGYGKKGNLGINAAGISSVAPMIIGLDFVYEFMMDMITDDPIRMSYTNAFNQLDLPLAGAEAIWGMTVAMTGGNVTEAQFKNITDKFRSFGLGMTYGRDVDDKEMKGMGTIALAANSTIEPFKIIFDIATEGVNPENAKEFKTRMRNRNTQWGMLDQIIGTGNDPLQTILKTAYTAGTFFGEGKGKDADKMSYLRINAIKSLILGEVGLSPYTFKEPSTLRSSNASNWIDYNSVISDMNSGHYSYGRERSGATNMTKWIEKNDAPTNAYFNMGQ